MKLLSNLTVKDKRALMLYLAVVLLCATFFAAGIFIGYSTPQPSAAEAGATAASFTVRITGLDSVEAANRLGEVLRAQRHVQAIVEAAPGGRGHVVKTSPFPNRTLADDLMLELRNAGYSTVTVVAEPQGR